MTQAQKLSAFSQALMVSPMAFRNRLINGAGTINQRNYVSGTATTIPLQYTLDRWRVVVSGQALVFAASGSDVVMTAPAGGVEQVIEGAFMEGGDYTLSWVGTATATVNGTAVANGAYINQPPASNATVRFSGGTFQNAQLEPGRIPTVFERRMGIEDILCKRYYEAGSEPFLYIAGISGVTYAYGDLRYLVQKRTAATVVMTNWQYFNLGSNANFTPVLNYNFPDKFAFLAQGVTNWNGWCGSGFWTANAEL